MDVDARRTDAGLPSIRSRTHHDYPTSRILDAKGNTTVSVCLPARNEESTVVAVIEAITRDLLAVGAIDEIVVMDDGSEDSTAQLARAGGARVENTSEILPEFDTGHGKGSALWKSLYVTDSDLVIWCDTDITEFGSRFVRGILGALICEPGADFAKGFYRRPERDREGGGRVTELVARPLLSLFHPELAMLDQPLSGEYGARREVLERLAFSSGYGVEIGLLIDYVSMYGTSGLVQVDLEVRHHRNRGLVDLAPQSLAIIQAVLKRIDPKLIPDQTALITPHHDSMTVDATEHPPMIELASYRQR